MTAIESNTKTSLHVRCNSLPSAAHPIVSQFEEHLNRLKSSESASSSSSSSINHKLSGLQDLHDCIDKLLQLTATKQALTRECSDELLDGSLRLLDICGMAKDFLVFDKESMIEIQSSIRRRGTETGFTIEATKYLASRKMMKKAIRKALGSLKVKKGEGIVSSANKENDTLSILREAEAVTMSTLESLLSFISDPKGQSKQSRWSTISKLVQPKRVVCDSEESNANEFEKVDASLKSLISHKPISTENFQSRIGNLEMCIEDLEVGVKSLSRQLIKTRVSLLNIFSH